MGRRDLRQRRVHAATVLGGLTRAANITITESRVYNGEGGRVVGQLVGTLIELHEVKNGTVRRMDIYLKDPAGLAAFVARSAAAPTDRQGRVTDPGCP